MLGYDARWSCPWADNQAKNDFRRCSTPHVPQQGAELARADGDSLLRHVSTALAASEALRRAIYTAGRAVDPMIL